MPDLIKAILIAPFNILIVIPGLILYFSHYKFHMPSLWALVIGIILLIAGLSIAISTVYFFLTVGQGTPAPWAPPKKLVVKGPYCYVRNPMMSGAFIILIAESLLFSSKGIFIWFTILLVIGTFYLLFFEEKTLIKRFGDDYLLYKNNVSRWIPRLNKWNLPNDN